MFDVVPVQPASERRARVAPAPEVDAPVLEEHFEYDDGPGAGVATYRLTLRNPHWNGQFTAGIWVHVGRHYGWKPHRWMAEVSIEFPDLERSYWTARTIRATQDEAAAEAAEMAMAARAMLEAHLRGETVETPSKRKGLAAEAHADSLPDVVEAMRQVDAARAERDAIDPDDNEKFHAHRRYLHVKGIAETMRQSAVDEFCRAHSWQEFAADWLGAPHVVR